MIIKKEIEQRKVKRIEENKIDIMHNLKNKSTAQN